MTQPPWQPPPPHLPSPREDVYVWRIGLDRSAEELARARHLLSEDELERADRFYFRRDADRFTMARGTLRRLLGRYAGRAPEELRFQYGRFGKPSLDPDQAGALRFNVSHSAGLALVAVAEGREVGVDVERMRTDFACGEIAGRFFSAREVAAFQAVPPALQAQAFFRCWSSKEAYIKAIGEGLHRSLGAFDVELTPGAPAALLADRHDPAAPDRWTMIDLAPGEGYAGALAVSGSPRSLVCYDMP